MLLVVAMTADHIEKGASRPASVAPLPDPYFIVSQFLQLQEPLLHTVNLPLPHTVVHAAVTDIQIVQGPVGPTGADGPTGATGERPSVVESQQSATCDLRMEPASRHVVLAL